MCVVSMVSDYYHRTYPTPNKWTLDKYQDYLELMRKAKLYDEMMKQKDCIKPELDEADKLLEKHFGQWKVNPTAGDGNGLENR